MINVVFASDNKYAIHCFVAIVSLINALKKNELLNIFILDGGISSFNRRLIRNYLTNHSNVTLVYYEMSKFDFSNYPLNRDYISIVTYYRLALIDVLPKNIDKVIYLDCDVIVKKDISLLWNIDLSNYFLGAVEDEGSLTQIKRLGLDIKSNYFNAGVIVFNLNKMREIDFHNSCLKYYNQNRDKIILQDQDILNGVFTGKCLFLELNWNANGRLYRTNELEHNYSQSEAAEAARNPYIIHFSDRVKPWNIDCVHPLRAEYYNFLKQLSCLIYFRLILQQKYMKIKKLLKHILPKNIVDLIIYYKRKLNGSKH